MTVFVEDSQVVGETTATLFTLIQPAPVCAAVIIKNSGVNTINYDFQEWDGSQWDDLGSVGTVYNNTLQPNQTVMLLINSSNSKVQMIGNASGGALLEFSVTRYFDRQSGGAIPILNL